MECGMNICMERTRSDIVLKMAVRRIKEKEGITEDLKSRNPMLWVRKVNNIMARAEEEII